MLQWHIRGVWLSVRILARRSGAKMPMVRPNEPYMVQVYVTKAYNTIMGCN